MKKLLGILGVVQLTAIPTLSVISCDNSNNFEQFSNWVKNGDSFVLYIGADDCSVCKDFDNQLEQTNGTNTGKEVFLDAIEKMKNDYNSKFKEVNSDAIKNDPDYKAVGYDSEVTNIDFHTLKVSKHDNIWNTKKWMKKMRDWTVDQYRSLLESRDSTVLDENKKDTVTDALKKMVAGKGTPIFILIRNGKFVGVESGYDKSNTIENLRDFVNNIFSKDFKENSSERVDHLVDEATDAIRSSEPALESLSSYSFNKVNLNNYF